MKRLGRLALVLFSQGAFVSARLRTMTYTPHPTHEFPDWGEPSWWVSITSLATVYVNSEPVTITVDMAPPLPPTPPPNTPGMIETTTSSILLVNNEYYINPNGTSFIKVTDFIEPRIIDLFMTNRINILYGDDDWPYFFTRFCISCPITPVMRDLYTYPIRPQPERLRIMQLQPPKVTPASSIPIYREGEGLVEHWWLGTVFWDWPACLNCDEFDWPLAYHPIPTHGPKSTGVVTTTVTMAPRARGINEGGSHFAPSTLVTNVNRTATASVPTVTSPAGKPVDLSADPTTFLTLERANTGEDAPCRFGYC